MRKTLYTLLAFMLFGINSYSQTVAAYRWAGNLAGTGNAYPEAIKCDQSDNVIIGGRFDGIVDLDPGASTLSITSTGSSDCYLVKLDENGALMWAKSFGGTGLDRINGVTIDGAGNIYAVGYFAGTVDFDPGAGVNSITSTAGSDFFVSKFGSSGNYIWTKTVGSTGTDYAFAIAADVFNNIYIGGDFTSDSLDMDPGTGNYMVYNSVSTGAQAEGYVLALDSAGNFLWSNIMKGMASDYVRSVCISHNQEIIVGGYFNTSIDLDPAGSIASNGLSDAYLASFNTDGTFAWLRAFGGGGSDYVYSAAISGNYVLATGTFSSIVDFDPSNDTLNLTSNGGADVFITKINTDDGSLSWAVNFGTYGSESVNGIDASVNGNIYVAGSFLDSTQLDPLGIAPTLYSVDLRDGFFSKFDSTGHFIFGHRVGTVSTDYGRVITVTPGADEFWTAGYYAATNCYIDPHNTLNFLSSGGANDTYIAKYGSCQFPLINAQPVNAGTCPGGNASFFVNATGSNLTYQWQIGLNFGSTWSNLLDTGIYSNTTTATLQLTGAGTNVNNSFYRCIITADCGLSTTSNVSIMFSGIPNTSVNQNQHILAAVQSNAVYQWMDCNNGYAPIPFATTQQYIPSQPGDYAVEITLNGCVDTSTCYNVTTIGLSDITQTQMHVYPIPAHSSIQVEMKQSGRYTAVIYDLNGRRVMNNNETAFDQFTKIDLSSLEAGTYLLGIKSADGVETFTNIIRH